MRKEEEGWDPRVLEPNLSPPLSDSSHTIHRNTGEGDASRQPVYACLCTSLADASIEGEEPT